MITKLTTENNEAYQARFELMNQAFAKKGLSLEIKSLEEYFANIGTIKTFTEANKEYKGLCFMMPVDEPVFEIDANSRTINVPAIFKKNGVGVIGDHEAETIYFKIDKYFDYTSFYDLLQNDNNGKVVINWAFTPAGSKTPTKSNSDIAFGPADNLERGCLIFGWIIDKEMTTAPGTLTFSVQFYHEIGGVIDYSFNTLTAQVSIGNGLTVKNLNAVRDNVSTFGARLQNGAYRVDAITGPTEPIWILDLPNSENLDEDDNNTRTLRAEAGIEKGTTIQYEWFYAVDENDNIHSIDTAQIHEEYIETEDTTPKNMKLYYKAIKENDNIIGYQLLVGDNKGEAFEALGGENAESIYERVSSIEADKAGRYSVRAQAKVDISDGTWDSLTPEEQHQVEAMTKIIYSNQDGEENNEGYCLIPAASEPEVELTVSSNLIVDPEVTTLPENPSYVYISSESAPTITAVVSGEYLGKFAVTMLNSENEAAFEALTEEDMAGETYAAYDNNTITVATDSVNAQGEYKVGIINRLNGTYAKGTSDTIETSFVAPVVNNINVSAAINGQEEPTSLLIGGNAAGEEGAIVNLDMSAVSACLFVDQTDYTNYVGCEKEYWLQEVNKDTLELVEEADPAEIKLTTQTFMPADNGYYRIKTITKYHDTVSVGYTDLFSLYSV